MIQAALHLTIAAIICLLARTPAAVLVAGLLLSLAPDLDTPKSLVGGLLRPLSAAIERRLGHRTATHSLLALALLAVLAYLLLPTWWLVLAGCYASHLLLDLLIGRQGVQLLWPAREWQTIAGWRDDGPAPRRMLTALLPALLLVAVWPQLGPALQPSLSAAYAVANPIATATPAPSLTPTPTPQPDAALRLMLPPGVGLSALLVRVGDVVAEGQLLASWEQAAPTPWPTPTAPLPPPSPLPVLAAPVLAGAPADRSALIAAQAAATASAADQPAERADLVAAQAQALAAALRRRDEAARTLAELQPQHERAQAEHQHAVAAAARELDAARATAALADPADPAGQQRAADQLHAAEVAFTGALDAQARMRTDQGIERAGLEAALATAQAELDQLPARQATELARLDQAHRAARILAQGRVDAAQSALGSAAAHQQADQARQAGEAEHQAALNATAQALNWSERATAQAQNYQALLAATRQAQPTPAPDHIISRAAGRILRISAEERDGSLVVLIELILAHR